MLCLESATRESYHVDFVLCCKSRHGGVVPQFSHRWAVKDNSWMCCRQKEREKDLHLLGNSSCPKLSNGLHLKHKVPSSSHFGLGLASCSIVMSSCAGRSEHCEQETGVYFRLKNTEFKIQTLISNDLFSTHGAA